MSSRINYWKIDSRICVAVAAGLLGLLLCNLGLAYRNYQYRVTIVRLTASPLAPGIKFETLNGEDIEGRKLAVEFGQDSQKTILFIFSPKCGWCRRNMENWRAIIEGIDKKAFRLVSLSTVEEGVGQYVSSNCLKHTIVIARLLDDTLGKYNLSSTPMTLLIDESGTIEEAWRGALHGATLESAQKRLGINLPGLVP